MRRRTYAAYVYQYEGLPTLTCIKLTATTDVLGGRLRAKPALLVIAQAVDIEDAHSASIDLDQRGNGQIVQDP